MACCSSSWHARLDELSHRHWQERDGSMETGISEALRSILPRGTTGRLNSKTICLPGGTSTPEGVMRVILSAFSAAGSPAPMEQWIKKNPAITTHAAIITHGLNLPLIDSRLNIGPSNVNEIRPANQDPSIQRFYPHSRSGFLSLNSRSQSLSHSH